MSCVHQFLEFLRNICCVGNNLQCFYICSMFTWAVCVVKVVIVSPCSLCFHLFDVCVLIFLGHYSITILPSGLGCVSEWSQSGQFEDRGFLQWLCRGGKGLLTCVPSCNSSSHLSNRPRARERAFCTSLDTQRERENINSRLLDLTLQPPGCLSASALQRRPSFNQNKHTICISHPSLTSQRRANCLRADSRGCPGVFVSDSQTKTTI